jgi:hypothetical protein
VVACMQLKSQLDDAHALAVAAGLVPAASLPASCSQLMRVQELPRNGDIWITSWTDTPLRHRQTGLIRYVECIV